MSLTGGLAHRVPQEHTRVATDLDVVVRVAVWSCFRHLENRLLKS